MISNGKLILTAGRWRSKQKNSVQNIYIFKQLEKFVTNLLQIHFVTHFLFYFHFSFSPLEKVCFQPGILGNYVNTFFFVVLFFCLLLHRPVVRISLPFHIFLQVQLYWSTTHFFFLHVDLLTCYIFWILQFYPRVFVSLIRLWWLIFCTAEHSFSGMERLQTLLQFSIWAEGRSWYWWYYNRVCPSEGNTSRAGPPGTQYTMGPLVLK